MKFVLLFMVVKLEDKKIICSALSGEGIICLEEKFEKIFRHRMTFN